MIRSFIRSAGLAIAVAIGAPAPGHADADVSTPALPVIERYLAATGGREARERESVVRTRGRLESSDMTGTYETWTLAPDRWMREVRLGPLRFREGFDGTTAWRTDFNDRSVILQSEAQTERAREEGWFLNERWTREDAGGGKIRLGSRSYGEGGDYDVLIVTPPFGSARRLFINTKTGYLERTMWQVDQQTAKENLSQYRTIRGRKRPTIYESPRLIPKDDPAQRVTVDSVWVNPPCDSSRFSPPVVRTRSIAFQKAQGAVRVPMAYASKTVLVRVSINGAEPADFILDTGASLTVLDRDFVAAHDIAETGEAGVQGIAANSTMRFAKVSSIAVMGKGGRSAKLNDFTAAVIDLGQSNEYILWRKPAGLLGADFLRRFAVELDFDSLAVTFHDPASFEYRGEGTGIPFELHHGIPVVEMEIDGRCSGKFMVDVGNAFQFVVHGSLVRPCGLIGSKRRREVEVRGGGVGGGFVSTLCRLDSVRVGPYVWTEPVAALALGTRGGIGSQDLAGNIGNSVLERFRCTFDYAHQRLYLEPSKGFGERDKVSRFGALWARVGDKVYAGDILIGSAAQEAGLRWYDEIVAIDDLPLARWTRERVDRALEQGPVGAIHRVTYRRLDEPETTVEVTLRDVL